MTQTPDSDPTKQNADPNADGGDDAADDGGGQQTPQTFTAADIEKAKKDAARAFLKEHGVGSINEFKKLVDKGKVQPKPQGDGEDPVAKARTEWEAKQAETMSVYNAAIQQQVEDALSDETMAEAARELHEGFDDLEPLQQLTAIRQTRKALEIAAKRAGTQQQTQEPKGRGAVPGNGRANSGTSNVLDEGKAIYKDMKDRKAGAYDRWMTWVSKNPTLASKVL